MIASFQVIQSMSIVLQVESPFHSLQLHREKPNFLVKPPHTFFSAIMASRYAQILLYTVGLASLGLSGPVDNGSNDMEQETPYCM